LKRLRGGRFEEISEVGFQKVGISQQERHFFQTLDFTRAPRTQNKGFEKNDEGIESEERLREV